MTEPSSFPLRILLVDDDKVFCQALSIALKRRGHEVLIAHNTEEGRSEVDAWSPSRVVIDLRMPGEGGLKLVEWLTLHHAEVKKIVLTGFGSIATAVDAVKLGAAQYLTKPVSADDVLRALEGLPPSEDTESERAPSLEVVEWEHLQRVLNECEGNISEAARRLGMHRRTLQRKLARGRSQ